MSKYSLSTNGSGVVIQAESASVSLSACCHHWKTVAVVLLNLPGVQNQTVTTGFLCRYRVTQAFLTASNNGLTRLKWLTPKIPMAFVSKVGKQNFKTRLSEGFSDYTLGNPISFGHILPGHGLWGKQKVTSSDCDLTSMYDKYKRKRCG